MLNRNIENKMESLENLKNKIKEIRKNYKTFLDSTVKYASLENEEQEKELEQLGKIKEEAILTRQLAEYIKKKTKKRILTKQGIQLEIMIYKTKHYERAAATRKQMLIITSSLSKKELIEKFPKHREDILEAFRIYPSTTLIKEMIKTGKPEETLVEHHLEYIKEMKEIMQVETAEEIIISKKEIPLECLNKIIDEEAILDYFKKYLKLKNENKTSIIEHGETESIELVNEMIRETFGEEQEKLVKEYVKEGRVIFNNKYGTPVQYNIVDNQTYIEIFKSDYCNTMQLYAHEIGHAVENIYKHQSEVIEKNRMYIEVPSTVYEVAAVKHLIKKQAEGTEKISIESIHVDYAVNTITLLIQKRVLNGEFVEDVLEDINTKIGIENYFDIKNLDIARVYEALPYVIGYLVAFNILERIEAKEESIEEKYTEYLKKSHSINGYEALKKYLDIDLNDINFVKKSQSILLEFLEKYS